MTKPQQEWTDFQIEQLVGALLQIGVTIAALVVFFGGVLYVIRYGATTPTYQVFRGEPADLRSVSGIVADALALRRRGLIQCGLLLLVATPVARVALSVLAFARQRDYLYVGVTLIVLTILLYNLIEGGL